MILVAPAWHPGITGNFYLCWLMLVTVAFLYNAAVGPLRTAFSRAAIYNVTGVYPPLPAPLLSTAHDNVDNNTTDCVNNTAMYNVTGDGR